MVGVADSQTWRFDAKDLRSLDLRILSDAPQTSGLRRSTGDLVPDLCANGTKWGRNCRCLTERASCGDGFFSFLKDP
jgi:hypothetical protein